MLDVIATNYPACFPDLWTGSHCVEVVIPAVSELRNAGWRLPSVLQCPNLGKQLCQAHSPVQVYEYGHGEQVHIPQDPRPLLC